MTLLLMGYLKILMLEIALAKSGVTPSWKQIDDLLPSSPLAVYITVLKYKFRVARLVRKIKTWFSEGRKSSFSYRFTGKETRIFCHKFMFVLLLTPPPPPYNTEACIHSFLLFTITICCIILLVFSCVNITQLEVEKCRKACLYSFNANVLLLKSVTPTVWTVGYAIPRHLQILFD